MPATGMKRLCLSALTIAAIAPSLVFAADPVATTDGEKSGVHIAVVDLKRSSGDTLTLRFNLINESADKLELTGWYFGDYKGYQNQDIGNLGAITLIDPVGKKKYFVVRDTDKNCVCSNDIKDVNSKSQTALWAKFPAPPADVRKISVLIPHFMPLDDVPISQ